MTQSRRKYEMLATVAEWKDAGGRTQKRTVPIGTVFESPNGRLSARLELIPIHPGWSGFVAFREIGSNSDELQTTPAQSHDD